MSREQSPVSATASLQPCNAQQPSEGSTFFSPLFTLTVGVAAIGLTLFGLNRIGEQERGVSAKAEGLLAKGQRFMGNKDAAARTSANTFSQNVEVGAKKVAGKVEEHINTAVTVVSNCLGRQ